MATLQQQVQQHLDNTGISLRELSRRSGVSHTTIGKILRGGEYKSGTADALNKAILRDSSFAQIVCSADESGSFEVMNKSVFEKTGLTVSVQNHGAIKAACTDSVGNFGTLHDKVEQLAADRVDCDVMTRDDALECGKQRRIEALEAEVGVWRDKAGQSRVNARNLQDVLEQREQHLKSCENALIEAHEKITKQDAWTEIVDDARKELQRLLSEEQSEVKRLTALSDTHGQSWKAACVQVEQLQKQLDHGQAQFASLHESYNQQVDDEAEMLAQIDALFVERDNMRTEYEYSLMRLRVYCFALVCAIVFLIVSGLVVWGAV